MGPHLSSLKSNLQRIKNKSIHHKKWLGVIRKFNRNKRTQRKKQNKKSKSIIKPPHKRRSSKRVVFVGRKCPIRRPIDSILSQSTLKCHCQKNSKTSFSSSRLLNLSVRN